MLFYHPAVWWVSERIRAERENCCDDVALVICSDRVGYASALTALEEWRGREVAPVVAATGGPLSGRVRRILDRPPEHRARIRGRMAAWAGALVLCTGIGAALWPWHGATHATQAAGTGAVQSAQTTPPAAAVDWRTSETDHFEIRYGTALADDIDRVEAAAERAYRRVSERLADDLPFRVPLILFATREEFERQDVVPGADLSGIASFSEPAGNRIAVLVEEWGDDLVARISHELTHVFAFEAVPRSDSGSARSPLGRRGSGPDYGMGTWSEIRRGDPAQPRGSPGDIPSMSTVVGRGGFENPRVAYALGHAAFDFVEAEWGRETVGAFMRAFGTAGERPAGPYQDVLGLTPAAFDARFADLSPGAFRARLRCAAAVAWFRRQVVTHVSSGRTMRTAWSGPARQRVVRRSAAPAIERIDQRLACRVPPGARPLPAAGGGRRRIQRARYRVAHVLQVQPRRAGPQLVRPPPRRCGRAPAAPRGGTARTSPRAGWRPFSWPSIRSR